LIQTEKTSQSSTVKTVLKYTDFVEYLENRMVYLIIRSSVPMKLIYRANSYDYDATLLMRTERIISSPRPAYSLIYRGDSYLVDPKTATPEKPDRPDSYELICRGTIYRVSQATAGHRSIEVQYPARRSRLSPRLKFKQMLEV
jgi:hypothetical protein